jgi:cytochrome P450
MLGVLFGLGPDDPRSARLLRLYPLIESATLARVGARRVRAAMAEIAAIVATAAADAGDRCAAARPPACSLDHLARDEPEALADPTLIGNLVYLAETGGRDIADLLCWALKMLGDHPEWAARLAVAARSGEAPGDGLAARVVAETLRLEQSEYIVRTARRPVRIEDFSIPTGWLVRLCVRESHRDPQAFPDPDRFDPDRFLHARHDARTYAPLGLGRHACLGRTLVEVTGATSLAALARGYDWRVTADGPREFGTFHWMPSRRFRVAAAAR